MGACLALAQPFVLPLAQTRGQPHSYTSLTSWTSFSSLTLEHASAHQAVHRNLLWGFSSVMEDNGRIQDCWDSSCIMWRTQGSVLYSGSTFLGSRPRHCVYQDTSTGAASVVPSNEFEHCVRTVALPYDNTVIPFFPTVPVQKAPVLLTIWR